jgi:hypothetical protein
MSKYKAKLSPKREKLTAQDAADEKQFFKWAIIITIAIIALIYIIMR